MKKFCKGFLSVLEFPFWLIVYPIMMLFTWPFPSLAKTKPFRWCEDYGDNAQKCLLVGKRSSWASFTFAHGLLHFVIFLFSCAIALWFYKNYINQSTAVKNKNLVIETEGYRLRHGALSQSNDSVKFTWFRMNWSNEDSTKLKPKDNWLDLKKGMSFCFISDVEANDTNYYEIRIHADFDLKIDTTKIRDYMSEYITNHEMNYEIKHFGENDGKFFIVINLTSFPLKDSARKDSLHEYSYSRYHRNICISADPEMFENSDPPYLNYFVHFQLNNLSDTKPDDYANSELLFSFWDSYSYFFDTYNDSVSIANYPHFHFPYELIEAKPEPYLNTQFVLRYTLKSFDEAIQRGVHLKFVNHDTLQRNDHKAFFYTVLFGALVSFLLTILVELITKWRNLNLRSGNKDPYRDDS